VLRGTKMFITNAGLADVIVVAAKTDPSAGHNGITTFVLERGADGMTSGAPLSRHQAIRHRLAAAAAELETARTITYPAAARWDAGHPEAATSTAMAKLQAPRIASRVVDEALQVFGGYGFIEETPVAMHYRDARILRIGGGTDEVQLEILAKKMGL
jgi:alkylation response protein AidB-like acyl-CoA dehydrogenase